MTRVICIAEDEEESPWLPLAAERGIPAGQSAVTVMAAESPHQVMNEWARDPREILETYAAAMRANMLTSSIRAGNYALVIAKQQRDLLGAAGWTKRDVRDYVFERARAASGAPSARQRSRHARCAAARHDQGHLGIAAADGAFTGRPFPRR